MWQRHSLCGGSTLCVAESIAMRLRLCPCSRGTPCATEALPVWQRHSPWGRGTSCATGALPMQRRHSPCGHGTFRHLSSTFLASEAPSVNIPCGRKTFHQLVLTFHTPGGLSVHFLFGCRSFCQHLLTFLVAMVPSTTFGNFQCIRWPLRQVPSTFLVKVGPSINFCQLSSQPRDFMSTTVNFSYDCRTFHQLSVHPQVHPSTSVKFSCVRGTFHQVLSTFCASAGTLSTFINFVVSVKTSINFCHLLCVHWNYPQFSGRPLDLLSTFVHP